MKEKTSFSRRGFMKGAAAAGAAVAFPALVPASALGANGFVAPSNRIVIGCIGVGSQGSGNMKGFLGRDTTQIMAVCDVDKNHRDRAKNTVDGAYDNKDCEAYLDFRDLIGRGDLDAVSLGVPDQWHAIPAIAAARAGLDIYGEKPLSRSIRESRAICDAVHENGRVWQTGSWQRSQWNFRHACELVRNGRLGRVHTVEVGLPGGRGCEPKPIQPVPDGLDWDFWLGPAPYRPYCDFGGNRCHWDWRWIMDYSGGQLTDWAGHHIDIAHWGLGYDSTGPIEVQGKGTYPDEGLWNAPTAYEFDCKYASGVVLKVHSGGQGGTKWIGDDGWIWVDRGHLEASNKTWLEKDEIADDEIRLYESNDHQGNFIECVKNRLETITPVETACRSISVGHLGEIAMLTGRTIKWDPEYEQIIGDPGASALLGRAYRKPWVL